MRINSLINKENKKAVYSLSLILMLTLTLMMAFTQTSLAQVGIPQPVKTAGYIDIAPTLIGANQKATVNLWVFPGPQNYLQQPSYKGYTGIEVTFTKPDGSKDTFKPIDGTGQFVAGQTESIGSIFFFYEPDMVGNWSASFTMPEQNITDATGTVIYSSCTSMTAYFTVQKDPVNAGLLNGYPWSQLPNDNTFWKYPINSNNREWSQISGDWLINGNNPIFAPIHCATTNSWQPYGSAPNSAHIVWSQPLQTGGLIGGDYGSISYGTNTLQGGSSSAVVMDGKVFVNLPNTGKFECVDLTTGKVLYTASGSITCGIHLPGNALAQSSYDPSVVLANSFGATPTVYLLGVSGATWNFYEPFTGTLMKSISNVSTAMMMGYRLVDGTPLCYGVSPTGNLFAWNLSKVVGNNWPTGIEWARPIFNSSGYLLGLSADLSTIVLTNKMDGGNLYYGFSAKDGASLWNLTVPYPASVGFSLYGPNDFVAYNPVDATFHCYSMLTGGELWTSPSFASSPWSTQYTVYSSQANDNDNLYLIFPDGIIRALSLKNGELVWASEPIVSTEYANNVVPYYIGVVEAGGNIYAYAGYAIGYQLNPIPRNAMLVCVNATTGDTTYTLNGGINPKAAANGYLIGYGQYDGTAYCLGKGQTSTSVTIQNNVVTNHATALITGNVLDQSPAQAGTPAVADSAMSEWMDYLHMQNATLLNNPPQEPGVSVTLTAVDPNGNTITIGTTTTDSKGNYAINFVPENVGMYKIKASFDGTEAYYSSDSEAHLSVIAALETTPTTSPIANPPYELYTVGMGVAVIVALAVAVLLLRRKP